ncbi:MAG: ribosome maturation factor RimM [Bacteroidia bacterium]
MTKNDCFSLGYIPKRVGNKGELAFILDVDEPARYKKLSSVFIEINGSLVPFFIKAISIRGNNAVVSLEGVDTISKAEELIKSSLYLPLNMLPPLKGKKFYFHEVPGYLIIDTRFGEVGILDKVLDFPQQVIFQVKRGDTEILIPAKDEFIVRVDRVKKQIEVQTPEGLIDLYLNNTYESPDDGEHE